MAERRCGQITGTGQAKNEKTRGKRVHGTTVSKVSKQTISIAL